METEFPTRMRLGPLLMVRMHVFPVLGTLLSTALVALMETVMVTQIQQAIGLSVMEQMLIRMTLYVGSKTSLQAMGPPLQLW
jgi:hypothetical protein